MVIGITRPRSTSLAARVCGRCGGILDAPRPDPHSGRPARKCAACRTWTGMIGGREHGRDPEPELVAS